MSRLAVGLALLASCASEPPPAPPPPAPAARTAELAAAVEKMGKVVEGLARQQRIDPEAPSRVEKAIRAMYEGFKQKSLETVAPHMTEGSTCYDVYTSKLLVGRKAVLDHFAAILARHKPDEKWEATLEDMKVDVEGELAVATYKVSTRAEGAHMLAAVTHVFRRDGERWLAVHLHRSWNSPPEK